MKALVTGGAGFIGSHIADSLIKAGHEVVILDDLSGGRKENVPVQAKLIKGSITDNELVVKVFKREKFDYVYHLAAYAAENLSHFIKRFNYNNNLIGSVNLINQSILHNIKCFVFTSSVAVYGNNQVPMTESLVPLPEDPYGIAKYAVELDLKNSLRNFGLNSIIFRPHNVYGERQNIYDKYRNVIGIFMKQILTEKPLTIFGDGKQSRAFTYINDIAPVIANSVFNKNAYNEVFNIGSNGVMTVKELAELISKAFGRSIKIKYLKERKEVKHVSADHEKLKNIFPNIAETSINVGIRKTADWVSENFDSLIPTVNMKPEIPFGLPDGW